MTDDYYEVDTTNYCIRGRLSGRKISLGDKLMVEVKGTSLRNRTIDFLMIAHLESAFEDTEMPLVQRRAAQAPGGKGQYGGRRGGMPMKKHGPAGGEKRKAKKGTSKGANKGKPKRRG